MQFNSSSPLYFWFNCYNQCKYFLIYMHFPLCKYMHTDLQKIVSPNAFQITRVKYLTSSDTTEVTKKTNPKHPESYLVKSDVKQNGKHCTVAFCIFRNKGGEGLPDAWMGFQVYFIIVGFLIVFSKEIAEHISSFNVPSLFSSPLR